jgi:sensor domain CHASE-containing protein
MSKKSSKITNEDAAAIAQKLQDHLKASGSAELTNGRQSRKGAFLWGATAGIAIMVAAPLLRPAARGAVKAGLRLGREAKRIGVSFKEEYEDITAEAREELDREEPLEGKGPQAV